MYVYLWKNQGATVYITGRTLKSKDGMGSIEETANEVFNRLSLVTFVASLAY